MASMGRQDEERATFLSKIGFGSSIVPIALVGFVIACADWLISDVVERNNDFCNACHLRPEVPLHIEIRHDFDARPPNNLAGLHGATQVASRAVREATRCIDCHRGVGLVGRAEVKLLAARDALVWLSGDFDEPTEMSHPLGEADCRQCHREFAASDDDAIELAFHARGVHNAELGMDCVACHSVHDGGPDPALFYLDPGHVRVQCARCHSEFQESR
jgi:nitrate/TMAO reductase-like tetraheme cytochrome c subunit